MDNVANNLSRKVDELIALYRNGGKGSGNFGHSGRPGKVGGSGEGKPSEDDYKSRSEISSPDSSLGTSKEESRRGRQAV